MKLDKTALKCMFVGYTNTAKQYRLYDPVHKKFLISRDVVFEESISYYPSEDLEQAPEPHYYTPVIQPWEEHLAWSDEFDELVESEKPTAVGNKESNETQFQKEGEAEGEDIAEPSETPPPLCTPKEPASGEVRVAQPVNRDIARVLTRWRYTSSSVDRPSHAMISTVYMVEPGPVNYKAAMETAEAGEWQVAVDSECSSLVKNRVLTFVDVIPAGKKAIPTRLVLQRKLDPRGETTRYKARLVAQGFRQVEGLDFREMFAPVASLSSVRILLAIAGSRGYAVYQMDVVTAFLGSELNEEVNINLPLGVLGGPRLARLNRSLYGLRQSPRCWYTTIDEFLVKQLEFKRGRFDCGIYTHVNGTILALYVDDILIAGEEGIVSNIRKRLKARFDMVDLGLVEHFLGMVITRDFCERKVHLTQEGYIGRILGKFGMLDCNPISTPLDKEKPHARLEEEEACDKGLYQQLVGSLGWIAIGTRPDISFAVSYLGRFEADPSQQHWVCAKRVLRYLAGTRHLGLSLGGEIPTPISLDGCVDADFAGDASSLKSTTVYVLFPGTGVVQRHSKRQSITATSMADAEFIASATAIQELLWFRQLVSEITTSALVVSILYNDNQASLSTFADTTYKPHSRQVGVRVCQVREIIEDGKEVVMDYCGTDKMVADGLTKPLVKAKHVVFVKMCGLC